MLGNKILQAAVIGDPISHSLSPTIHNYFLQKYKISGNYQAIQITKDNFNSEIKRLVSEGFVGFNVTIPHKEKVIEMCNEVSEVAKLIGAINTVSIRDGKLHGDNSDAFGFVSNLKSQFPDFDFKNKKALIIGAGGASRAVVYALITEGCPKVSILNRNQQRAVDLASEFRKRLKTSCKIEVIEWSQANQQLSSCVANCDLLINCTSLGMTGQEELIFDLKNLKNTALVYDLIYNPITTNLLFKAKKRGNSTINGLGMLIQQAKVGFESWFGIYPETDEILVYKLFKLSN